MKKNPQTKDDTFWILTDFHGVIPIQSPTCTPAQKFHHWIDVINPEMAYMLLLFQILCIDWLKQKTLTFTENL